MNMLKDEHNSLESSHDYPEVIFVVGNSRSGTTMMSRILGCHPEVFTFGELHFFEQLWKPTTQPRALSNQDACELYARLLAIQREGYYSNSDLREYRVGAKKVINSIDKPLSEPDIFLEFLHNEAKIQEKRIPCDQTPRNVYYLPVIFSLYPKAFVVNIIRDPRDVMLSQKNRWRRRYLSSKQFPIRESVRSRANYHPFTMSLLWRSGIKAVIELEPHPRLINVRFEELIQNPGISMKSICERLNLEFSETMLQVPQIGSSLGDDRPGVLGLRKSSVGGWRQGGLSQSEIFICQRINSNLMKKWDYVVEDVKPSLVTLGFLILSWPIKTMLALVLNISRSKEPFEAIRRRLGF